MLEIDQNTSSKRPRMGGSQPIRRPDDKRKRLGPYSPIIDKGVGAATNGIDARTREGRFLLHYEKLLTDHVGGKPSTTQRLLIMRAARTAPTSRVAR